jgi:glycosyltransferase involved in cell wall biosynthesis
MPARIVFDVSTLLNRAGRAPTGISRVQMTFASSLARLASEDVEFCALSRHNRVYERVDASTVLDAAERMRSSSGGSLRASVPSGQGDSWRNALQHGYRSAALMRSSLSEARLGLREAGSALRRRQRSHACLSATWSSDTIYCSFGYSGDEDLRYLSRKKREVGFRVALAVHDLTAVVTPQYHTGGDGTNEMMEVLEVADTLFVLSLATRDDIVAFGRSNNLKLAEIRQIAVGPSLVDETPVCPHIVVQHRDLHSRGFVLCVGTIEIRKNHHLLLDIWEMLIERYGVDAPTLVLAGRIGWISAETVSRINRTPQFSGRVVHVDEPTDGELAWLYQRSRFTVYPALYEGWGLPVTESLDFGKLCLTSDRSSLPEAGGGLTELLDPFDRGAWSSTITRYFEDASLLASKEARIARHHRPVNVDAAAQSLLRDALAPDTLG